MRTSRLPSFAVSAALHLALFLAAYVTWPLWSKKIDFTQDAVPITIVNSAPVADVARRKGREGSNRRRTRARTNARTRAPGAGACARAETRTAAPRSDAQAAAGPQTTAAKAQPCAKAEAEAPGA